MEPNIILEESLLIAGVRGDGSQTGRLWKAFENLSKEGLIGQKVDDAGYEVRIYREDGQCDCLVGMLVKEEAAISDEFDLLKVPNYMYAVWEVHPVQGYDSVNNEIEEWLDEHKDVFEQGRLEGSQFSVLVYNHKYKGEDDPESIVEIRVSLTAELICQSCSMPLSAENMEMMGTNQDGSRNKDYCIHCYQAGEFTKEETMEEMIESCIPFTSNNNPWPDAETARNEMMKIFPKLKRWKNS